MTILKKKPSNKTEESSDSNQKGIHGGSLNCIQNYNQNREILEDCFENSLESLENDPELCRIRTSPARVARNKYRDKNNALISGSPSRPWSDLENTSPKPGPSTACDSNDEECNSEDEYLGCKATLSEPEWQERDRLFERRMKMCGFEIRSMKEDGACLFRAVADQVYGDQEMHDVVRRHCMDYIAANRDYYSQYLTEDFNKYINRKRQDRTHGNHIEIQAMCEMYNRPIEVFCYSKEPITFHGGRVSEQSNEPIRLSYQRNSHYNSIVDPNKATVGVGLGLPNFSPGSADRNLMKDAVHQSEQLAIEQTMLEDKIRATDWEATNEAIEEQVARESYLQWFTEMEARKKSMTKSNALKDISSCTSASSIDEQSRFHKDVCECVTSNEKSDCGKAQSSLNFKLQENGSFIDNFPPELFGHKSD